MTSRLASLLGLAAAACLGGETARDLIRPNKGESVRVIVQYREEAGDGEEAASHRRASSQRRLERKGAKPRARFEHVNAAVYDVAPETLEALENDPDVLYVSPDREVGATVDTNAMTSANYWPVIRYFDQNWQTMKKGAGLGVAVIDSGVHPHKNLMKWDGVTSRVVHAQSFVGSSTGDEYGHGTHVAGIIASFDVLSQAYADKVLQSFWGPAIEANIVSLKVLDATGKGADSGVIAAIDRAIQLKTTHNIKVINLSLGRPVYESYKRDPLCQAVERAWRAGIVVVVAAGNYGRQNVNGSQGYGTITAPGNHPMVITVGAVNQVADGWQGNDYVASYSSKGPTFVDRVVKPDVVVPGSQIQSLQAPNSRLAATFPANRMLNNQVYTGGDANPSPHYIRLNGTSMATPLVSGGVLLMLSKDRNLTPDQVKFRLMKTAWRGFPKTTRVFDASVSQWFTVNHDIFTMGAGMVNLEAAFWCTDLPAAPAHSPLAVYDALTKTVKLQFKTMGTNVVWGDNTAFPSNVLWGENVRSSTVLWGENVVWGTQSVTGFNVVWGTTSTFLPGTTGMTAASTLARGE